MFNNQKYRKYSDEELVVLIQQEQKIRCVGILYERYGHLVFGLALNYLKNKEDAQDLVSHVFENMYTKLQKHTVQHFKSWLYTLSKNECLMILRKKSTRGEIDLQESIIGEGSDNVQYEEKELQLELLEQQIVLLKPEQQQCIRLFYLEEKSYQQVSEELDLPLNKVKSAIQNGKRNLKLLLEQHHEFK